MHVCGARALAAVLTVATLAGSTLSPTGGARVREGPVALQKLEVAPGTLKPVFNGTRTGPYTVSLPFGTDTLKLTATVSRSGSPTIKVQVAGGSTIPVTHGVPCAVPLKKFGNTTMQVQVKGSDSATMVYNVIAVKPPEPDASLKLLTITSTGAPGKLQPTFKPLITNYSISEDAQTPTVEIMAVANDSSAQVKINGVQKDEETGKWNPLPIAAGRNTTVVVSVLTNHGKASANMLYFVNITRAFNRFSDSTLKTLELDADQPRTNRATLTPAFSPFVTLYRVDEVPNASIVRVSVSANQSNAKIRIGKNYLPKIGSAWRSAEITVPKRTTDVKVRVTSPNEHAFTDYTLRLSSAGPGAANPADADYWQRLWGCGKVDLARKGDGGPCGLFWLALVASFVLVMMSASFVWVRRRTRRFSDADVARYAHAVPDFRD